jgi:chorismate mutase
MVQLVAIRGATTADENNPEAIKAASLELVEEIVKQNQVEAKDIVTVFLTMTSDLTAYNASSAIRLGLSWNDVAFFTSQEPNIDKGLPKCLRILIQCYSSKTQNAIKHIYLKGAVKLRLDLSSKP